MHDIPLPLAVEATAAAVADCAAKGFSVSAALVDRAGILRAPHRADNAGPHTVDASRRKAFTALSLKIGGRIITANLLAVTVDATIRGVNSTAPLGHPRFRTGIASRPTGAQRTATRLRSNGPWIWMDAILQQWQVWSGVSRAVR